MWRFFVWIVMREVSGISLVAVAFFNLANASELHENLEKIIPYSKWTVPISACSFIKTHSHMHYTS